MSAATPDREVAITVYIANHNYERYVAEAIESVLGQTRQDFELIVIDDGSEDDSHEVLARYEDSDRVRVVYQKRHGLNVTNNIAFRLARGRYFMRLDADDYLVPHALEVLSGVLDRHPEVGLVFPDYWCVAEDGSIVERVRRHDFNDVQLLDQPAHGACTMIRHECLEALGGYDEAFSCQDGVDLWLRFIEHFEVRNVNEALFHYRQHGSNLTRDEHRLLDTRARILARRAAERGGSRRALGVVPIRGHRIDHRSLELSALGDRPLVEWTVDAALEADGLDAVAVTTPDRELIAHLERRYERPIRAGELLVVERSTELAALNSDLAASVSGALEEAEARSGERFDVVVSLLIESPFRKSSEITAAVDVMTVFDVDSVVSIRPELDLMYQHRGDGMVPLRSDPGLRLEREELYREAGQIFASRAERIRDGGGLVGGRVGHVVVAESSALRLTSAWSWHVAGAIAADPSLGVATWDYDRHERASG